ncbi:MAG TPA: ABC transporter permease [Bryobacteraceae bacterium]|nr:ABC transporter permease [Bryobacteraceae bacterium]
MSWMKYFRRARRGADFDQELEAHLAHEADILIARGMNPRSARQAAIRKLGNVAALAEQERDRNTLGALEGAWRDIRYAIRQIRLSPSYAAVVILSIALGTGANTAIFQLLDAVRLRSLPVRAPQELASVSIPKPRRRTGNFTGFPSELTNAMWERIRERQQGFSGMFAWSTDRINLSPAGQARFAQALWVSGDLFRVLDVAPVLGRAFTSADDGSQCSLGAVISYSFWQREFGGNPAVIGQKLTVNTLAMPVLGVAPPQFFGLDAGRRFDVALPLCAERVADGGDDRIDTATDYWLGVMGRLKPGWTVEQASAQLNAIAPGIFQATLPPGQNPKFVSDYLALHLGAEKAATGQSEFRGSYESPLLLLLGASGLVLIIACANLASIALARASAREREIAVRLAIGGGRARVMRQLLAESLVLALIGAAAGLALGGFISEGLARTLGVGVFLDLKLDWRVIAFTSGVAIVACMLFGLAPALRVFRLSGRLAQAAGGRGVAGAREGAAVRRGLAITQIALSLALVTGALLFVGSLRNLMQQDPGFQAEGVNVVLADISGSSIPKARRAQFYLDMLARMQASSAVRAASLVAVTPVGGGTWNMPTQVELPSGARAAAPETYMNEVTAGYFAAMGTRLLSGRGFDATDTLNAPKVAIVNQAFVRQYLKGANPLGARLTKEDQPREAGYEIIGLAADAKYANMREEFHPIAYLDAAQDPNADTEAAYVVRASNSPDAAAQAIKAAAAEMRPQPILDIGSLPARIEQSLTQERLMARLSAAYGLLAAILAAVGVYGALAYLVTRRKNEIGVRMALGASRGAVVRMVLREAISVAGAGIVIGAALAIGGTRVIEKFLFGITPANPIAIVLASLALAALAMAASYAPARRASSVDPAEALRRE